MVLKKSRFGHRSTGNTQRNWSKDFLPGDGGLIMIKEVSNDQVISRSGKGVMNPYDGNLDSQVYYSLKKKKRWSLLETLHQNQLDSPIDFKVDLDAPKTSSDVVIKVHLENEIETRGKKSKKTSRYSFDENDEVETIPNREIKYIIKYPPVRRRDHASHNYDKHLWVRENKSTRSVSEEEIITDFERWEDNEELDPISSQQNTYSENNLFDYLMKAQVTNRGKKSKLRLSSKKRSSSVTILPEHVIYENREVPEIITSEPPVKVNEVLMIAKFVEIWADDLKEDYLKENFENDYHELDCMPRIFLIRISNFLKEASDRKSKKDLINLENIFLVFNVSQTKITSHTKKSVRVYLHGNFNAESLGIETLHSHETYSIQSIIIKTVDYLTKIMFASLLSKETSIAYSGQSAKDYVQTITNDYLDMDINVFTAQEAALHIQHRIKSLQTSELESSIDETFEIVSCCNICYEIIQTDGFVNGMALLSCHHWICNSCWHNYIISQFLLTKSQILCPAYDCKSSVPIDIIRTIVGGEDFTRYMLRNSLMTLNIQANINWCPNPICGHVAVLSRNNFQIYEIPINCVCQRTWCFGCQKESHWPASCKQVIQYTTLPGITNWKEKEGAIVEVLVKNCPTCKYPIEKFHGCTYMVCKCGASFCWDCLQTFDKHNGECKKNQFKHLQSIELIDVRDKHYNFYSELCDFHYLARWSLTKLRHKLKKKMQYIKFPHSHGVSHNTDELLASCQQVIHEKEQLSEEVQMGILTLIQVHKFCEFTAVWLNFSKFNNLMETYIATNLLCQLHFLLTRVNQHLESKNFVQILKYMKQIKKAVYQLSVQVIRKKIEENKRQQQNETKLS